MVIAKITQFNGMLQELARAAGQRDDTQPADHHDGDTAEQQRDDGTSTSEE